MNDDDTTVALLRAGYIVGTRSNIEWLAQLVVDCQAPGGPCERCNAAGFAAGVLTELLAGQVEEWGMDVDVVLTGTQLQ